MWSYRYFSNELSRNWSDPGLILLGQITAIGNNNCSRCICRGLRSEEQDSADHFRRLSESLHGDLFYQARIDFFRSPKFLCQRSLQVVWCDGIDPDMVSGPFNSEAFCQQNNTRFGSGLCRCPRYTRYTCCGGNVDNAPASCCNHFFAKVFAAKEGSSQIDPDDGIPFRFG